MDGRKCRGVRSVQTFGMTEAAGALAHSPGAVRSLTSPARAVRVGIDVKNDVVWVGRVGDALDAIERIEAESIPHPPGHHMIRAGRVAADPEPSDFDAGSIKRKSSAEHVYAADALADHRIIFRTEQSRLANPVAIRGIRVDWVAVLQTVQAAAGLYRRAAL